MTLDEICKLVWDIRCSVRGEEFFELLRDRCLVDMGIELTVSKEIVDPKTKVVSLVWVLDPTLNISQAFLNLVQGKQAVYHDLENLARMGQKACQVRSEE